MRERVDLLVFVENNFETRCAYSMPRQERQPNAPIWYDNFTNLHAVFVVKLPNCWLLIFRQLLINSPDKVRRINGLILEVVQRNPMNLKAA